MADLKSTRVFGALMTFGDSDTKGQLKEQGQRVFSPNNRNITSSVSSTSSTIYASAGAAKTAYDRGTEALTVANSKLASNGKAVDSDKLDGIDSSVFARKDQDVRTSANEVSVSNTKVAIVANDGAGNSNITFNHMDSKPVVDGGSARIAVNTDGTTNVGFNFHLANNVKAGTVVSAAAIFQFTTSVITFNGNTVWHAGNDGHGTGLNADLLDGQHGTYYAKASDVLTPVPSNAKFTDTNTQRGVVNSLTSTSTTTSLTANQGRVLKDLIDERPGFGIYEMINSTVDPAYGWDYQMAVIENNGTNDRTLDLGKYLSKARVGDRILIRNKFMNKLTIVGVTVYDENYNLVGTTTSMTGRGQVSFYLNNAKRLVKVAAVEQ